MGLKQEGFMFEASMGVVSSVMDATQGGVGVLETSCNISKDDNEQRTGFDPVKFSLCLNYLNNN